MAKRARLHCEDPDYDTEELLELAADALGDRRLQADFEHGQWWITDLDSGAQWSVNDCTGPACFDFEQVTRGEED
jgi:predicted cupin superfamily sugar epimerase